jgi:transketolase
MRDHFIIRLHELARRNPRIVLITGDLGFGVFDQFSEEQAHQFINAGVAEQNMTMLATGMALEGHIVFTYSIGNFPTLRCLEMIRNDAAYHDADVKVVCIGGGFSYGALGISHHATEDLAIMRSLPEVTVVSPCGLWETMEATTALVKTPGTCYLRLDKSAGEDSPDGDECFQLGRMRCLREGTEATIIVTGGILCEVQKAAKILAEVGVEVCILSCHTLKPFDVESLLQAVARTQVLITVEEHTICGGLGGLVAETLLDHNTVPRRFRRIGLRAGFSSIVGSQEYLRKRYGLDADSIAQQVRELTALER